MRGIPAWKAGAIDQTMRHLLKMVGKYGVEPFPFKERFYRPRARTASFTYPLVVPLGIKPRTHANQACSISFTYGTIWW